MEGGEGLPPLGTRGFDRHKPWRSGAFVRLGAALVVCAVAVSALFAIGSLSAAPARSTPPTSLAAGPSAAVASAIDSPTSLLTPTLRATPTAAATATATATALSGPIISDVLRFDSKSGLIFLSDAKGDYLRATNDGGSTWSELRSIPSAGPSSFGADFLDVDHGWRAYDFAGSEFPDKGSVTLKVSRTTDSARSWHDTLVTFATGISLPISSNIQATLHFRDRSHGVLLITFADADTSTFWPPYFCGEFTTSDGGATWSSPRAGRCLDQPKFVSALVGYAGIIDELSWSSSYAPMAMAMTVDGGNTWIDAQFPNDLVSLPGSPSQIFFMRRRSDGTLRALCSCGPLPTNGFGMDPGVISSNDGGKTWISAGPALGFGTYGYWVGAVSDDRWLARAAPSEKLLASDDGGLTWQPLAPAGLLDGYVPGDVHLWSNGWAVSSISVCGELAQHCVVTASHLYVTDDGGKTLRPIATP